MYKNDIKVRLKDKEEESTGNYQLQSVWWTPADIEKIWETIADYSAWSTWWRGIQKVEQTHEGDPSGVGTVLRQEWRSWIPYTLVFDLEVIRLQSKRLLEGRASGDLNGICKWTFTPVNDGVVVSFDVNVRTGRWWMNLPIPFASMVVRSNFETIMHWGREGLAKKFGVPVELRLQ